MIPATRMALEAPAEDALSENLAEVALEAAAAGASEAMAWFGRADLRIEEKAASDDLVSEADRSTEHVIRSAISRHRESDAILGEEGADTPGSSGIRWLVDPIDGTTDFLYGRADWAVSVAAIRESDGLILAGCVVEPVLGTTTHAYRGGGCVSKGAPAFVSDQADLGRSLIDVNFGRPEQRGLAGGMIDALMADVRDIRRGGSAACSLARVATGRCEAYWGPGLAPWDGSAGMLLVAEAGGAVGSLEGATAAIWPESGDILASRPALHEPLRQILLGVYAQSA